MDINSDSVVVFSKGVMNPDEIDAMRKFNEALVPLLDAIGAKVIGKFEVETQFIGNCTAEFINAVQFPNAQVANDFFDSAEYENLLNYRDKAFSSLNIFLSKTANAGQIIQSDKALSVTFAMPNPSETEALQEYAEKAGKLSHRFSIKPIAKYVVTGQFFGECKAGFIAFSEADNSEEMQSFFDSSEYQKLVQLRDLGLKEANVYDLNQ